MRLGLLRLRRRTNHAQPATRNDPLHRPSRVAGVRGYGSRPEAAIVAPSLM